MSGKKLHPELVIPELARRAITETNQRGALFTHYIMDHFHATGRLAPGCDFKDLLAWYEINMPTELESVTRKASH